MVYDKYLEYLKQFPNLVVWLDIPTYPEAERYLGPDKAKEFREAATRSYIENMIGHVAVKDIHQLNLQGTPYFHINFRGSGRMNLVESHQLVCYHLKGEQPFARAFAHGLHDSENNPLFTLSDVAAEIEQQHPDEEVVVDGCVIHRFNIKRQPLSLGLRGLTIWKVVN